MKKTYLTKCQSGKWWQQTTTWYTAAIVYKIFFHEIYFPHSTFRVSSKVHMSHYLSLSLSGTGWEVLFLSTGSYILWRTFSRYLVSVILKPQVFNLKLVTQQIEMFLPQKITDPEIVAILQDGWLRCKEFSTPSNSFYPSSSGQSNSGARLLTSAASSAQLSENIWCEKRNPSFNLFSQRNTYLITAWLFTS